MIYLMIFSFRAKLPNYKNRRENSNEFEDVT